MTKEEAIVVLRRLSNNILEYCDGNNKMTKEDKAEIDSIEIAIKALEQKSSDDCVSRADLLKLYEDRFIELQKAHQTDKQLGVNWCINTLKNMPPVTPTQCIAAVRFSKEDLREICNERIEIECTHETCKDCTNYVVGALDEEICLRGHELIHKNFYCADLEKRGTENGSN